MITVLENASTMAWKCVRKSPCTSSACRVSCRRTYPLADGEGRDSISWEYGYSYLSMREKRQTLGIIVEEFTHSWNYETPWLYFWSQYEDLLWESEMLISRHRMPAFCCFPGGGSAGVRMRGLFLYSRCNVIGHRVVRSQSIRFFCSGRTRSTSSFRWSSLSPMYALYSIHSLHRTSQLDPFIGFVERVKQSCSLHHCRTAWQCRDCVTY